MAKNNVGKKPISQEEYTTNKVLAVFSVCLLGVLVLMIDLLAAVQQEPVCKVALFCRNAAETNVLPYYRQMFDDKLQVALSGADWVDLMRLGLSKGVAVGVMCDNLHITPAQCMAFGDYLNDVELLRSVGESYAMANAHERLKKVAKHVCPSNDEDGVCRTIDQKQRCPRQQPHLRLSKGQQAPCH